MRQKYPSDISLEQFEKIRPLLERKRWKTHPIMLDLYDVFCGVLYVLKSGCQWRMLPSDYPRWQSCYAYWRKWAWQRYSEHTVMEEALKQCGWHGPLRLAARRRGPRKRKCALSHSRFAVDRDNPLA